MSLDLMREKGTPIDDQKFDWFDLVRSPISKLNDDAFTRVRVILMNGVEQEANRFSHAAARMSSNLRIPLARIRRLDHHQQTLVNWLLPPDQTPLETTIGYEQAAIEVTAHVAIHEPDPYIAQAYRFGMLEDFDHMYRFAALMDRVEGKDANNLVQSYTDIAPGRPTWREHRAPEDEIRHNYDHRAAHPLTRLHALTIMSAENQVRDYYMTIGPLFADPVARQVYAEIASVEEQHVTQYESLTDPAESIFEKWLLHEASEVYNYLSCVASESNPRVKTIWERLLSYELGQLQYVMDLYRKLERRDPFEILPATLPEPIKFQSHRQFVRETLENEVELTSVGTDFTTSDSPQSIEYRARMNAKGSPTEIVSQGYAWAPGTELARIPSLTKAAE